LPASSMAIDEDWAWLQGFFFLSRKKNKKCNFLRSEESGF